MDDRTSPPRSSWPVPLDAVLDALRGQDVVVLDLGPRGRLAVTRHPAGPPPAPRDLPPLEPRAARALHLVAAGEPAAVVADDLAVPIVEVAGLLRSLRERYGVDSTTAAVEAARRAGDLDG
ncbi:hypothetical protein [Kineococcus sp. SYSU DK001]|uniref:hypothetical protein n=1 Tax=Kineococcus sp. SYSU DK001 TaxID=3383122 RepID=UPI003D7C5888